MHAVKKAKLYKRNWNYACRLKHTCQQDSTQSTKKAGYKKHTSISIPFQN